MPDTLCYSLLQLSWTVIILWTITSSSRGGACCLKSAQVMTSAQWASHSRQRSSAQPASAALHPVVSVSLFDVRQKQMWGLTPDLLLSVIITGTWYNTVHQMVPLLRQTDKLHPKINDLPIIFYILLGDLANHMTAMIKLNREAQTLHLKTAFMTQLWLTDLNSVALLKLILCLF